MSRCRLTVLLLLLLAVLMPRACVAAPAPSPAADESPDAGRVKRAEPEPLRIAVAGDAPFVITSPNGGLDGLSVRVWKSVADQAQLAYKLLPLRDTTQGAVEDVAKRRADIAIGPIAVTSKRARMVSFTVPYYSTTLAIATVPQADTLWGRVKPYLAALGIFLALVVGMLFVVGNIIWLLERHRNPETFPSSWLHGVGTGMWLAVVTMTGVGYGDTVPVTGMGRLVAAIWMLLTMLFASTLTAGIASMMTEYRLTNGAIDTVQELAGRRVAVVGGTAVVDFVNSCRASIVQTKDVNAAVILLLDKRVDAVVYHTPELRYWVQTHPEQPLLLAPLNEVHWDFAIAATLNSPLVAKLDVFMLQLSENGDIRRIEDEWISEAGMIGQTAATQTPGAGHN